MEPSSPFHSDINPQLPQKQRKRLNLKPRDDKRAARLQEQNSLLTSTSSLFGDAKPREVVIADRDGKTEEEVLREEVKKEKLHLRLTPEQNQQWTSSEAAVKEIEEQIEQEEDEKKREMLKVELDARKEKLDGLMERFAKEVLSEGGKHVGQRERYNPTRNSAEGATAGMMNPTNMHHMGYGGHGGVQQQYHLYNRGASGDTGGYNGYNNGAHHARGGRQNYTRHQHQAQGIYNGYGSGVHGFHAGQLDSGGAPQPYHGGLDGAIGGGVQYRGASHVHPYLPTPMNPVNPMNHLPHGSQLLHQMHVGHPHAPSHATQHRFYQGPPTCIGMGGEIEFDATEFSGARY